MKRDKFIALARELGTFSESDISLMLSAWNLKWLTEDDLRSTDDAVLSKVAREISTAIDTTDNSIRLELAKLDIVVLLVPKVNLMVYVSVKDLPKVDEALILGKVVGFCSDIANDLGHHGGFFIGDTSGKGPSYNAYSLKHKYRKPHHILDEVDFLKFSSREYNKSIFLWQGEYNHMSEYISEIAMKLCESNMYLKLKDGLEINIPTVV